MYTFGNNIKKVGCTFNTGRQILNCKNLFTCRCYAGVYCAWFTRGWSGY